MRMNGNRIRNAFRNIVWGIMNKIVNILLPFICRTILIQVLGAEYLGLDGLFTSILQVLNIAELGISSAIVFSMYEPVAHDNWKQINALLNLYKKIYRIIGVVILIIGIAVMPLLKYLIKGMVPSDVNLYLLFIIFLGNTVLGYWLFAYKKTLLSAYQREDKLSNVNSIITIIKTVVQLILVCVCKRYYIYIIWLPIFTIIENVWVEFLTKKFFPQCYPEGNIDTATLMGIKKHVAGLFIQKICATSRNSIDSIIISAYIGLSTVTIYGNYYYILAAIHGLLGIILKSISGVVGNTIVENTPEMNHKDMLKFNFIYMWIAGLLTVCLLCIYQPFMRLWMGEKMLLPNHIMIAMCVYVYALCIGDIRTTYYVACGLWWEGKFRALLESLLNIVLNIILGKYFGLLGIIVATLISLLVINFCYGSSIIYRYYYKNISKSKFYFQHIYYAVVTIVAGMICFNICEMLKNDIIHILIRGGVCFVVVNIVYIIAYCKMDVCRDALQFVKNIWKKRF